MSTTHCHYHPGAALTAHVVKAPTFAEVEINETDRTILRCSVSGCCFVAQADESNHVNVRFCNVCGARIVANTSLTDNRCNPCRNKKARRKRGAHWHMKSWRAKAGA